MKKLFGEHWIKDTLIEILGSILAALCFPVLVWVFGYTALEGLLAMCSGLLIVVKHGENIQRLLRGTESKLRVQRAEGKEP